jgi:hypothetical protein
MSRVTVNETPVESQCGESGGGLWRVLRKLICNCQKITVEDMLRFANNVIVVAKFQAFWGQSLKTVWCFCRCDSAHTLQMTPHEGGSGVVFPEEGNRTSTETL